MARRAVVQPRWLDSMLWRWGLQQLREQSKGLGYPSICTMLKDGIPATGNTVQPWEISPQDFKDLEAAFETLDRRYQLALTRCYRPWAAAEIEYLLREYEVNDRTWRRWVHDGARNLEQALTLKRDEGFWTSPRRVDVRKV